MMPGFIPKTALDYIKSKSRALGDAEFNKGEE
jgi:hypothetical protein